MIYYALVVAAISLAGAAVPLRFRPAHTQLQIYLSLAAGALLGAGLFHLLPESSHFTHHFGLPCALGVLVVFLLQRYLAPHSHELSPHEGTEHRQGHAEEEGRHGQAQQRPSDNAHDHRHDHGTCSHDHHHHEQKRSEHLQSAGPFLTGVIAIFALSIHSLFDGIALGAASTLTGPEGAPLILSVFLSVLIHKPMDGLSVSVLLMKAGVRPTSLWIVQFIYAALVPVGAIGFQYFEASLDDATAYVGYTLAFSAGTFLAIALTDLLPELHFHSHDRNKLSLALLSGMGIMYLTSLIGHGDNGHNHGATSPAVQEADHDHTHDGHDHGDHEH